MVAAVVCQPRALNGDAVCTDGKIDREVENCGENEILYRSPAKPYPLLNHAGSDI